MVLITTKIGTGERLSITYDGSFGFESILREIEITNGGEWAELRREASRTIGAYSTDYPDPVNDPNLFGPNRMDEESWESI